MGTMINTSLIRKCIGNGEELEETVRTACLTIKKEYRLEAVPFGSSQLLYTPSQLYLALKNKGFQVGEFSKGFSLSLGDVAVNVHQNNCVVLNNDFKVSGLLTFDLLFRYSLADVENFIVSIPQIIKEMKEAEAFVRANYEATKKAMEEGEKRKAEKANEVFAIVKQLLDGKDIYVSKKWGSGYTDIRLFFANDKSIKFRIIYKQFFSDQKRFLEYIGKCVDLLLKAEIKVELI